MQNKNKKKIKTKKQEITEKDYPKDDDPLIVELLLMDILKYQKKD